MKARPNQGSFAQIEGQVLRAEALRGVRRNPTRLSHARYSNLPSRRKLPRNPMR
jgi:hypothetical protein